MACSDALWHSFRVKYPQEKASKTGNDQKNDAFSLKNGVF